MPAIGIALCVLLSCGGKPMHAKKTFFRMDTVVEVTLAVPPKVGLVTLWSAVDSLLKDWEERFSQTHERSELSRLNGRSTSEVEVSPELAEMLAVGLAYGDTLEGWFDLTVLPIKELWGFGEEETEKRVPSDSAIAAARARMGYKRLWVDPGASRAHFADSRVQVDMGGIAKGFALREIGRTLDRAGQKDYLIVAGGDILSRGRRRDGRPWRIGIQHPRSRDSLLATIDLDSGAVVTSGDYERFWVLDGVRYHHIFDPFTGRCCGANRSLTVWGMDPVEVDVLSTGLFCRSHKDIVAFVNARPRLQCVVVDSAGRVHVSEGWCDRIKPLCAQ